MNHEVLNYITRVFLGVLRSLHICFISLYNPTPPGIKHLHSMVLSKCFYSKQPYSIHYTIWIHMVSSVYTLYIHYIYIVYTLYIHCIYIVYTQYTYIYIPFNSDSTLVSVFFFVAFLKTTGGNPFPGGIMASSTGTLHCCSKAAASLCATPWPAATSSCWGPGSCRGLKEAAWDWMGWDFDWRMNGKLMDNSWLIHRIFTG